MDGHLMIIHRAEHDLYCYSPENMIMWGGECILHLGKYSMYNQRTRTFVTVV
jgi:hypothetical protein